MEVQPSKRSFLGEKSRDGSWGAARGLPAAWCERERKAKSLSQLFPFVLFFPLPPPLSLSPSLCLISHTVPVLVSAVMLKAACCVFDCLCLREGLAGRAGCCEQSVGWRRLSLRLTFNKFIQQSVKLSYPHHHQPHVPHFFIILQRVPM